MLLEGNGDEELKEGVVGSDHDNISSNTRTAVTLSKWLEEANGLHVTLNQVHTFMPKGSVSPSFHTHYLPHTYRRLPEKLRQGK